MAKSKKIGSCLTCKHINRENVRKCKAFPDRIPLLIAMGGINHDKPLRAIMACSMSPMSLW